MAKAVATCTCSVCGKTFHPTAVKYNRKDADEWEAWAADHYTMCSECELAQREADRKAANAEAAEVAEANGWCELKGTAKQVAWAQTLRATLMSTLDDIVKKAEGDYEKFCRTRPMFDDPHDNPRIRDLLDLVGQIPETDKVIIFAKYTHEINAILSVLNENGRQAVPFYGSVSRRERQASLEAFRTDARFLVANKVCAGYGLNLQYCHRIIYYSNDWDWATRAQSEDRVHRLGQTEQVEIIDIVARGTLDERIMKCLARKERLEDCIKRELAGANDQKEARGKFKKWLKGELNG